MIFIFNCEFVENQKTEKSSYLEGKKKNVFSCIAL